MSCNSGFVDDVIFSHNGSDGGVSLLQQSCCSVVYVLTPLMHGTGSMLTKTMAGAKTSNFFVQEVPGWSLRYTIASFLRATAYML